MPAPSSRTGGTSHTGRSRTAVAARSTAGTRDERKLRTRRSLLDAALELLSGERSFSSLSLREVTRSAGVVPAAFYRHFPDMEALGLVLVEESFTTLRELMREARSAPLPPSHLVRRSIATFLGYVEEHPLHFRFIAKERYGGSTTLRFAIRSEIRLWVSDLAVDLARFPNLRAVSTDDLQLVSGLVVQAVVHATELTLDLDPADERERAQVRFQAERQLLMILLGAAAWQTERPSTRA
ncbi:MAG: TetR family transcriptional regulator [Acidimicrobiales bacterium]|nr:TetR family transcriptional regulator [Acidimicrobiales bacterium]